MPSLEDISQTCFMQLTRQAARRLTTAYEAALKPVGLTGGQFSVLVAVALNGPAPMSPLAEGLGMDRTTLSRGITPLQRRGLLTTSSHPQDSRVRLVAITPGGREVLDQALPLWEQAQATARKAFSEGDAAGLQQRLLALSQT